MARPREHGERVMTAIRFPTDLHAQLVEAAAERELPINWLVNAAVRDYLARLIPVDEIVWTRDP